MRAITEELESKLRDVITDYCTDLPDADEDDLQVSLSVIINAVEDEDAEDLTIEGGIDAHYNHLPILCERLLDIL